MNTVTEYNKDKVIGMDVSLDVCVDEGYLMVEFAKDETFDRTKDYNIFAHYPEYAIEESYGQITEDMLMVDTCVSFDELIDMYYDDKQGIDSFAETSKHINFEKPCIYDLLHLASDINAYKGL